MTRALWSLLGLVALVAGFAAWNTFVDNPRIRETADADRTRDSLAHEADLFAARQAVRDSADAARAQQDAVWRDSLGTIRRSLARARDETAHLTADLEALLTADTSLSDTVVLAIRSTVTALEGRAQTCEAGLSIADSALTTCGLRLLARDSAYGELDSLLHAQTALAERYRALSHPGLLTRLWRALPWLGIGTGIGLLLGK